MLAWCGVLAWREVALSYRSRVVWMRIKAMRESGLPVHDCNRCKMLSVCEHVRNGHPGGGRLWYWASLAALWSLLKWSLVANSGVEEGLGNACLIAEWVTCQE